MLIDYNVCMEILQPQIVSRANPTILESEDQQKMDV